MNEFAEAWLTWCKKNLKKTKNQPIFSNEHSKIPEWLRKIASYNHGRNKKKIEIRVHKLFIPTHENILALGRGESIKIGYTFFENYGGDTSDIDKNDDGYYNYATLKNHNGELRLYIDDDLEFEEWMKDLLYSGQLLSELGYTKDIPKEFLIALSKRYCRKKYFLSSYKTPEDGIRLRPLSNLVAQPISHTKEIIEVNPYCARLKTEGIQPQIILCGWWLQDGIRLDQQTFAILSLKRNKVNLDGTHPDFKLIEALKHEQGKKNIALPSQGTIHIVSYSKYLRGLSIDADIIELVIPGKLMAVRRELVQPDTWGTLLLTIQNGHLAPIAKFDVNTGTVFQTEEGIFTTRGFEILGIEEYLKEAQAWTPETILDPLKLERAPKKIQQLTVDHSNLLFDIADVTIPILDNPVNHNFFWASAIEYGVYLGLKTEQGLYRTFLATTKGEEIDLNMDLVPKLKYTFSNQLLITATDSEFVRIFDTSNGKLVQSFYTKNPIETLEAAGKYLWIIERINHGGFLACRYDWISGEYVFSDKFSVFGLPQIHISDDGKIIAFTVANAPADKAFTMFVAIDKNKRRYYLGRLHTWISKLWKENEVYYIQVKEADTFKFVNIKDVMNEELEKNSEPFVDLVYDVIGHYGFKELFATYPI